MKNWILSLTLLTFFYGDILAQCQTWTSFDAAQKDQAENLHVVYRDFFKRQDYEGAFESWKKIYELAPAADGRDWHFKDGIEIYKGLLAKATDDAKKKEYKDAILALYDACIACYQAKVMLIKGCNEDKCRAEKIGLLYGEKAFDMFYTLNTPYNQTLEALDKNVSLSGNKTLYTTFMPYASIAVYEFQKQRMPKEKVAEIYDKLTIIADYGIANDKDYSEYFKQAKAAMNAKFEEVEKDVFDCMYFKKKLEPDYRANPDNSEVIKYVYNKLLSQGCGKEDDLMKELEVKWQKYAEEENARRMAEFETKNPEFAAKRLYDEGNFTEAITKYKEALEGGTDDDKKGEWWLAIASIQFRKLDQYATARESAYKAAKLKANWGQPYLMIGEMYARSSSSCGGDAFERGLAVLAAISKWSYARSIDSGVADQAGELIGRYSKYTPPAEDIHQRGANGKSFKVPCWIGESVTVSL